MIGTEQVDHVGRFYNVTNVYAVDPEHTHEKCGNPGLLLANMIHESRSVAHAGDPNSRRKTCRACTFAALA